MSCRGCRKNRGLIDENKRFKMKFVGRPDGRLMSGAPGNYKHGEIYDCPYSWSRFPYWQILDPPPVLKVPPAQVEESVFESQVFVPPEPEYDDKAESSPFEEKKVSEVTDMPPDVAYELKSMGDGVIGAGGEEKIVRKKVKKQLEGTADNPQS